MSKKFEPIYIGLILLAFIWAFNNIGSKIISDYLPPFTAGALRFALASVVLVAFMLIMRVRIPVLEIRDWLMLLWLSFVGMLLLNYVFFVSFPYTLVSETYIIVGLNPVLMFVFSVIFIGEKWHWAKFAGVLLAFSGVAIAFYHPDIIHSTHLWGDFLFSLSVVAWVVYSISMKGLLRRVSPIIVTVYTSVIGTIMLAAAALIIEKPLTDIPKVLALPDLSHLVTALLYVGIIATAVAYILWSEAVARVGPSTSAVFIALVPPLGVVFSSLLLHEPLYHNLLFGLGFIIAGIILTTRDYSAKTVKGD